ncbi:MAG: hypothetical protein J7521_10155 [Caulobacter sp.]|nr:hypothetical protein [Caulobacter sp.]
MKELTAYVLDGHELRVRPAPVERDWMDRTGQRFAYRCLPLNIANTHGWELLCPAGFRAIWDGGAGKDAIQIEAEPGTQPPALSHFGGGVLTFHVPAIFQTDPDVDLYVTGPINRPKDGIGALTGVVETDWSPYTFTMNWLFTRPDYRVRFEKDEPFCHIFPVARGALEGIRPLAYSLARRPELEAETKAWSTGRDNFNADLADPESEASKARWQKSYFRGATPSGKPGPDSHRSKLRLNPFKAGE